MLFLTVQLWNKKKQQTSTEKRETTHPNSTSATSRPLTSTTTQQPHTTGDVAQPTTGSRSHVSPSPQTRVHAETTPKREKRETTSPVERTASPEKESTVASTRTLSASTSGTQKSALVKQLEKEQREKKLLSSLTDDAVPTTPKKVVEPKKPLTEDEFISYVISFVFQVTCKADDFNLFYLSELAKELDGAPLLTISQVDSIVMEVTEKKRQEQDPGMLFC